MPKVVDRDAYRRELLERCFRLFSRKGYANTSMREIARELGVSTGTLYHYFPTKEKMLEHMLEHVRESNVGEYLERSSEIRPVRERLNFLAEFWKEHGEHYQDVMLIALDFFRNQDPENREHVFAEFSDYYTRAMAGQMGVSEQFGRSLFIYLLGLVLHTLLTPNHISYDEQIALLRHTLIALMEEAEKPPAGGDGARKLLSDLVALPSTSERGKPHGPRKRRSA